MPSAGEILNGRYRLDDRIAAGGMGEVWRATDTVLGRDVAVKTLHADRAVDPGFQTRFRNEARAMAALHHPGVADVYDFGETANGSDAYIVMARVDGEPLTQRIAERGRLSPAETMSVVAQAGRALEAAHQAGIVHRDVKPGNLVIERDGTVVLVDFGVARSAGTATLTGVGEVVGTAMYIAPEQVSKDQIGPATDVYALGVVAYHCLAGQPPFLGDNPIAIAMQHVNEPPPPLPEDVPPAVRQVVTTAMAKSPAERYPSAAAMAEAADRAVGGGDTTAILAAPGAFAPTAYAPPAYATEAYPPPAHGAEAPVATTAVARGGRRRVLVLAGAAAVLIAGAATAAALLIPDATDDPGATVPSSSVGAEVGTGNAPAPAGGTRTSKSSRPGRTTPAPGNGEPRPSTTAPSASASPSPSESTSPPPDDTGSEPPDGGNSEPPDGGEQEPDENEPDENENPPENGEQPVPPPAQP